jgi:hypothetical protein
MMASVAKGCRVAQSAHDEMARNLPLKFGKSVNLQKNDSRDIGGRRGYPEPGGSLVDGRD